MISCMYFLTVREIKYPDFISLDTAKTVLTFDLIGKLSKLLESLKKNEFIRIIEIDDMKDIDTLKTFEVFRK